MDKIEYHAVIKFFVKEGLTPNDIHSKFRKVYEHSPPSFSTIKNGLLLFSVKENKVGSISRKGHGIGVLGC
jgi:hypothetical protein